MVLHLVQKAINWVLDWLTEKDRRRRKTRLRAAKRRLDNERQRVRTLMRKRIVTRWKLEYARRGVLIEYRKAQLSYVMECLAVLEEAKKTAFTKVEVVSQHVLPLARRRDISPRLLRAFLDRKDRLHRAIAESKVLTEQLKRERQRIDKELKDLTNQKTHKALGAKKKIKALLQEQEAEARQLLASGREVEVAYLTFQLEERCASCRAGSAAAFVACPLCGKTKADASPLRYFKKNLPAGAISCPACHAPAEDGFSFCFNCGEAMDPFGLRGALAT